MKTLQSYQSQCHFSAAHRYLQNRWSDETNLSEFGPCFNPHGHGHDYRLEVEVLLPHLSQGSSKVELDRCLQELRQHLDHRHLNFHIEEFRNGAKVPTTENLAVFCARFLMKQAPQLKFKMLRLFETSNLWVELDSQDLQRLTVPEDRF